MHAGIGCGGIHEERGCLETRLRRFFPTSDFLVEDALIEFHSLERAATADDTAQQGQAAQPSGDWPRAAALWRRAAEATGDAGERARHLKLAAWCDDMAVLSMKRKTKPKDATSSRQTPPHAAFLVGRVSVQPPVLFATCANVGDVVASRAESASSASAAGHV